jgi:hypothetical protein
MATPSTQKSILFLLGASFMAFSLVQCAKEPTNASQVSRALVEAPDSAVFSPFYDSTVIAKSDAVPDVNDMAHTNGVLNIVRSNCASASCHGGAISPSLTNYKEIKALVQPGNPEGSKLFQLITTSDLNKAMPPITYGVDLSVTEKVKIYNWIRNGAKEGPGLDDYRPAAISLLTNGCGSANCHNAATIGGEWARAKLINIAPGDTVSYLYINPTTGSTTIYAQLKEPVLSQVWGAYKDSARKFIADSVANASFRPYKSFSTRIVAASRRGPLNTYDDIIFDIIYPKALRALSAPAYTDANGKRYYNGGDTLSGNSTMISRIDSTILAASPKTGVFRTTHQGDMAYGDGGLNKTEIAIIKAWYFGDPNVPEIWKYGKNNAGIFKYRKTGNIIKK